MFTHLHLHTQYSLLEGAIKIPELTSALKQKGFDACAITDHGNMYGAMEFYHGMKKAGLKPLIGMGLFASGTEPQNGRSRVSRRPPQTQLICLNREGYRSLTYLSHHAFSEGKQNGLPCVDESTLEKHHQGLVAFSGGLEGVISQPLLNGRMDEARRLAGWYRDVFEGRFYLELQDNGLERQQELNRKLYDLAEEMQLPLVASNDCFYLESEEAEAQHILWLMGMQARITDEGIPEKQGQARHLRSEEEMLALFPEYPQALENTGRIAEACELDLDNSKFFLPRFNTPPEHTLDSWLRHEAQEGLKNRLSILYQLYAPDCEELEFAKPYQERLDFELDVVIKMDYPGYFLIVADFINWAKDHSVAVGPGRGSGAGSLVAYALRITDVDPMRYGLLFERFLNPDRISLPDFDIDFDVEGRDRVIDYVRERYGELNVCQISTFGTLKAKAAVRGVARVLDFSYGDADKIAKLVPNELNISLDEAIRKESELARLASEGSDKERQLLDLSRKLEGLSTHLGTHAAGVIIMDQDLREVMPVCTGKEGTLQSMYPMKYAEDQGAVKFDFLGLQNLSTIEGTLELINQDRESDDQLDISRIPMDDPPTFKLLCAADTAGVFQLESSGMKRLVSDMQPSSFEDIVAILALYRPGPLGSGMVEDFVQCKHGRKQVIYPHPLLKSILEETYGVMVYQEQIMQAVQVLARFTLGHADLLRRAIGKKIPEEMAEQRDRFIRGCLDNPVFVEGCGVKAPEDKANDIFDLIDYFAGYGFNKSHTVAYGLISYQTAYLKAHYPVQFMAALLNGSINNPDKIVGYISDCREMEVTVLPPDVNLSEKNFSVSATEFLLTETKLTHLDQGFPGSPFYGTSPLPHENYKEILPALKKVINQKYSSEQEWLEAVSQNLPGSENRDPRPSTECLKAPLFLQWLRREGRVESVRFGLNAVKNVGGNAVDAIIDIRLQTGKLDDFLDFLKTVDLNRLNRRMLETLAHCGAFDSMQPNRAKLSAVLDEAVYLAQEHQRNQQSGQHSLFELMDQTEVRSTETRLNYPDVRDWKHHQRLKLEKDSLGFYVSGHPLDRYASEIKELAVTTMQLQEGGLNEQEVVSLAGIVVSKTIRLSRSSEKFAIIVLEDLRGSLEIPVFARVYSQAAELLEQDEPLLFTGRVSRRDEGMSLMVDRIRHLSEVRAQEARTLDIWLNNETCNLEQIRLLRGILQKYPGEIPVQVIVRPGPGAQVCIRLEEKISANAALMDEFEEERLWFKPAFHYQQTPEVLQRHSRSAMH